MTGILFDLDGTLLNTLDDLMDAVNHTMEVFGYPGTAGRRYAAFWATEPGSCCGCPCLRGRTGRSRWQLSRATIGSIARSKPLLIPASWKRCTP